MVWVDAKDFITINFSCFKIFFFIIGFSFETKKNNKFMKIASSLKSLKKRDLNSKLVRRRGRVYIINKKNPKFKARQK